MPRGSRALRTRLMSVVFPAPDGPETMNSVPSGWKLLDILNLLADALDLGFQLDHEHSNVRGSRLRAYRVDLPDHLLGEKVELLPGRFLAGDRFLHLLDVVRKTRDLFGDVALLDHDHHLLGDAILVDVDAGLSGDLLHALPVRGQQLAADVLAMPGQLLAEAADGGQARGDVALQRLPLPGPHGLQLREGLAHEPR